MTDRPTKTITVRRWGVCENDGAIPHKLVALVDALRAAGAEVPVAYLDTATVDCEPDYEFGEHYESMRITYERPMTDEELARYEEGRRAHWVEGKRNAEARAAYCAQMLAETFGGE